MDRYKTNFIVLLFFVLVSLNSAALQVIENSKNEVGPTVKVSVNGGFYNNEVTVELMAVVPNNPIFFTTDGSLPTLNSDHYTGPVKLSKTTVIRAFAKKEPPLQDDILTQSYFVNEATNLPVVSVATNPENFFSDTIGIYVTGINGLPGQCDKRSRNLNQDWERPVNIEFFEVDGSEKINQLAGVKIFGGCSRTRYPQKSLAFFARKEYGTGKFNYRFFQDKPIDEFESFLLRSAADDQVYTMFRDPLAQAVMVEHMDVDYQAYRPVVLFVNGEYWGIHNLREKINENYLASNYNVDDNNVNILDKDGTVVSGRNERYKAMMSFVETKNLSVNENYEYIKTQLDVDQYIDYQIANIYLAERDWPGNNIKFWSADSSAFSRWRWLQYDRDQTFKHIKTNAMEMATEVNCNCSWPNPPWSTLLFRRLLQNEEFRNRFIQLFVFHMSTTFEPNRLITFIDRFEEGIEDEIPRHIERWGGKRDEESTEGWQTPTFNSISAWRNNVEVLREFSRQRPQYAAAHIESYFKLNGSANVRISVNNQKSGYVTVFHKKVPVKGYAANHFKGVPMTISAIAMPGFNFTHWEVVAGNETIQYSDKILSFTPSADMEIKANFSNSGVIQNPIVIINEINYHSSDIFNTGDWVELYNRHADMIDLTGWMLKDDNNGNAFYFPKGTCIKGNSYFVLAEDVKFFDGFYDVRNWRTGDLGFKFNNSGDVIGLYNNYGQLVDSVRFDDQFPWPIQTDGVGYTMELIDVAMNNDNAENWLASLEIGGTPGWANGELVTSVPTYNDDHLNFMVYPNPITSQAQISFALLQQSAVKIELFDLMGNKKMCILNEILDEGKHLAQFSRQNLKPGIYLVQLSALNQQLKVLKISVL